ncbi:MAG TPA: FemAB family PEP-CTERM system-associated protein [Woeseiaceae bacterium]|nr:FemAB family PEP-CTERM system-associated protein [Woeseiaceae bacterium]
MDSSSNNPGKLENINVGPVPVATLSAWDRYVDSNDAATFFHRAGWYRVIQKSFNHTPHYLQATDSNGDIRGILPLFEVKSLLFGHFLVSLPFAVYGGAVADNEKILRLLEDSAAELAVKLGVDYLELRNKEKTRDDWPSKSMHATFVREIEDGDEAILLSIKNKQRAVVRKSINSNFSREIQDNIVDFFHAYSVSVRNLGTPIFSRKYFANLKNEFGSDCEIVSIRDGDELHCSLLSFYFKDQVLPYYGGGLPQSRTSKAMDYMYFDLMCRAGSKGCKTFDFGRSKIDTGPYNYKRHWGFTPQPLHYQYFLVNATAMPELNVNNPRYKLLIAAWQKLPLKLSQIVGPLVSKYLG